MIVLGLGNELGDESDLSDLICKRQEREKTNMSGLTLIITPEMKRKQRS
jgi:hypothetical protein